MSSDESNDANLSASAASAAVPPPAPSPLLPITPSKAGFTPLVAVVDFHHARGPEVEAWYGVEEGFDPAVEFGWGLLPFMALSDGAHASEEDFSYFTLLRPQTGEEPATSLFGIACTRQLDSSQLINRPADVTRSTVQKAVVVIADSPQFFGMLRERMSIVTQAWFAQRDFADAEILRRFQESLADEKRRGALQEEASRDQHLGMSLRELIHEFKWQTLVLLKSCLLQPKMLFFGTRCDRLCMVQFSLISLIPGLIRNLQDCADPELNSYEQKLSRPTSLQSSNRSSLLTFMGLPLQIFGKGSLFGPYTPLQQLDVLADFGTKSYIVGSTNSLLLQQKDRYSDILINLDENTVTITSTSLKQAVGLTAADRRWIDFLTQEINDTWDEANPSRPNTLGYRGSEEFIRSQFEAYILGLISSVKYHKYLSQSVKTSDAEVDPAIDFGLHWVEAWMRTENYRMWDTNTDENLFAVSEPKHPCAGGLTIDDIQRHISEQVKDLHLDERLAQGRDMLGRNLAAGREKASSVFNKLYSDVEYLRESQRRRAEEARGQQGKPTPTTGEKAGAPSDPANTPMPIDLTKAQQSVSAVGAKAGAFMSSWASWAGERRKTGGWGGGWGKKSKSEYTDSAPASPIDKDYQMIQSPGPRASSHDGNNAARPLTQESFSESILSGRSSMSATRDADHDLPSTVRKVDYDDDDDDDDYDYDNVNGKDVKPPAAPPAPSKAAEAAPAAAGKELDKPDDDGFKNVDIRDSKDDKPVDK
ncbi:transport protein Avl9-domain-containing protein [Stachybotrys elegans]|uniref:Transport protein Avl9-domain-containing protein n=1 Tax=Stachybotrys elegans TaxID=80388 RepID=A0A8K0T033_9HYPO|nr:transport protein Avl9-domain-containing protein [Stachybotrys elegans]